MATLTLGATTAASATAAAPSREDLGHRAWASARGDDVEKDVLTAYLRGPKVYTAEHLTNQDGWYFLGVMSSKPIADDYPEYDVTFCRTDVVTAEKWCTTETMNATVPRMQGFRFQIGLITHAERWTVTHAGSEVREPFEKTWVIQVGTETGFWYGGNSGGKVTVGASPSLWWNERTVRIQRKSAGVWRTVHSARVCGEWKPGPDKSHGCATSYRGRAGTYRAVLVPEPGLLGCVTGPARLPRAGEADFTKFFDCRRLPASAQ